jgi:hexosaminidase
MMMIALWCFCFLSISHAWSQFDVETFLRVVPFPQHVDVSHRAPPLVLAADRPLLACHATTKRSHVLMESCRRFLLQLRRLTGDLTLPAAPRTDAACGDCQIRVTVHNVAPRIDAVGEYPEFGVDESYELRVVHEALLNASTHVEIEAQTPFGARHALETLLQIVRPSRDSRQFAVPVVEIRDRPRFPWRGVMLDVVRHWMPLSLVLRSIDTLAAAKFNVLHLHVTDDQGIRIHSRAYPELTARTTHNGEYFSGDEIEQIVRYAALRGIRVVPEFNMPAHSSAWIVALPHLAREHSRLEKVPPQLGTVLPNMLDPSLNETWVVLERFFDEMLELFPDRYWHMGGDEPNFSHWNSEPAITEFAMAHGLHSVDSLMQYFTLRLRNMLARRGKRMVQWEESVSNFDTGVRNMFGDGVRQPPLVPVSSLAEIDDEFVKATGVSNLERSPIADVVCHIWMRPELASYMRQLRQPTLVSRGYYMDFNFQMSEHYSADPLLGNAADAVFLGGEATFWAEWMTPENLEARMWPRGAVVAERLWSSETHTDLGSLLVRLQHFDTFVAVAGSQHRTNTRAMMQRIANGHDEPALETLVAALKPLGMYPWKDTIDQRTPLIALDNAVQGGASIEAELFIWRTSQVVRDFTTLQHHASHLQVALSRWQAIREPLLALVRSSHHSFLTEGVHEFTLRVSTIAHAGQLALEGLLGNGTIECDPVWRNTASHQTSAGRRPHMQMSVYISDSVESLIDLFCAHHPMTHEHQRERQHHHQQQQQQHQHQNQQQQQQQNQQQHQQQQQQQQQQQHFHGSVEDEARRPQEEAFRQRQQQHQQHEHPHQHGPL